MMDQATASKVSIHGSGYQSALLELIDEENLPVEFGGSCECKLNDEEKSLFETGSKNSKSHPSHCAIRGPRPTLKEVNENNFENFGKINKNNTLNGK